MRYNSRLLIAVAAVLFSSLSLATPLPGKLLQCRPLADDAQRLACYDRALQQLATQPAEIQQPQSATVVTAPNTPPTAQTFGQEHLKKPAKPEPAEPEQLSSQVLKVKKDAYRKQVITLANGQVWKMVDKQLKVKPDEAIRIKRGMFSAYYLGKPGVNKTVRVKRLK